MDTLRKKNFKALIAVFLFIFISSSLLFASGERAGEKPTLSIICFAGYAEPAWVEPFEEKYDCTVNVTYAGTVEEHFTKVKAAPDEYNIVSNDSGRIQMYYDAGLIQEIDTSKLSNYSKIGEFFREHSYAQVIKGKKFHVPITWGAQFMTINTAKIPQDILKRHISADGRSVSYDILTDPDTKNLTAFFDEPANIWSIAAIHIGLDSLGAKDPFNFPTEAAWESVSQRLLEWKRNARTYTVGMDSELGVLMNEDALVSLGGNDAPEALAFEDAGVSDNFTAFPGTEGTICWIDGWVITKPTTGDSLDLALKYIDYMIGDQGQAELADLVGFGIVNPAGAKGSNPIIMKHSPWYGEKISDFPVPLYIMLAEEDPGRRVTDWAKIKAMP
jgi:putative spermidine/putrescine transport system substrate-binding protein/spermidine/putrescine transport system substrate-binding protein